jgi:DNA-binding IclR family transcriptional regulator
MRTRIAWGAAQRGSHRITVGRTNSKWKLGYKAFQIGSASLPSIDLNAATAPELHLLAEQHQVDGFLGVLRGQDVVYLATVQSGGPISITNAPASRTYLHSTALGKALLLDRSDDEVQALLRTGPLKQLSKKTERSVFAILKDQGVIFDGIGTPLRG